MTNTEKINIKEYLSERFDYLSHQMDEGTQIMRMLGDRMTSVEKDVAYLAQSRTEADERQSAFCEARRVSCKEDFKNYRDSAIDKTMLKIYMIASGAVGVLVTYAIYEVTKK